MNTVQHFINTEDLIEKIEAMKIYKASDWSLTQRQTLDEVIELIKKIQNV